MNFNELLHILGDEPVFESSMLLAGNVNPNDIRRQLSRWTKAGRIHKLKRGLYVLANPYRKKEPHPFRVANLMVRSSYVSLQSALSYYGMIPEFTAAVTCVTTKRPGVWVNILGRFEYRHIKPVFFHSYHFNNLALNQHAFISLSEKALLDLIYLVPNGHSLSYLNELRLHFSEQFQIDKFLDQAEKSKSPKLIQAGQLVKQLFEKEKMEYESL